MVIASSILLWVTAAMAVALVSIMFWIFLYNRDGKQHSAHVHFLICNALGVAIPVAYLVWHSYTHEKIATPFEPVSPEVAYRRSMQPTRMTSTDQYLHAPGSPTNSQ